MGSINYLQAIRPDTGYLKKIIERSLLSDWAIRIEYQGDETENKGWWSWDKTFFAIRSAEGVLAALNECYSKHPHSCIRINAEKFRPETRILYTIYDPQLLSAETDSRPRTATRPLPQGSQQSPVRVGLSP